jgi:hypothetical protein
MPIRLVRLGSAQLGVLGGTLVALLAIVWVMSPFAWRELYIREVAVPRIEKQYGFRVGEVGVRCGDVSYTTTGITAVVPGGAFAQIGLRAGDVPSEHHGHGFAAMYDSLVAAERGHFAAFDVINGDMCDRGKLGFRTMAVRPLGVVLAVGFYPFDGHHLLSPDGRFDLVAVSSGRPGEPPVLRARDLIGGNEVEVYSSASPLDVVWAPDASWIVLSEWASTVRCVLLNPGGGDALDLSGLRVPALQRGPRPRIDCQVFGWLQGTSLVALRMWVHEDNRQANLESVFFDTATRTFVRADEVQP